MNKSPILQPKHFTIAQKIISILFLSIFTIILIILLCFDWVPYCSTIKNNLFPNIISLIIAILISATVYYLFRNSRPSDKSLYIVFAIVFILVFIFQVILLHSTYFYTGWDPRAVNALADNVANTGPYTTAGQDIYLTIYPNNSFIVSLLALIKTVPFFGKKYLFLLIINTLIVDISGLLAGLTIKKLVNNKAAILSLFVITPLVLLSPWIIIPYSDTLSMLFPILVFFIYITSNKWWKYGVIVFLSLIGYFIKPTAIIVLIAIILIELCKRKWRFHSFRYTLSKSSLLKILGITNGICLALLLKNIGLRYINYQPNPNAQPVSFIHYLAMGQNSENCGGFLAQDYDEAKYGTSFEFEKFCNRLMGRSLKEQMNFFTRKLLMNFNDGSFAWGGEGYFYYEIPERNSQITNLLSSIFYSNGSNYTLLSQTQQIVWIFVLFGCLFAYKNNSTKNHSVLQLSLIGLFMFLMLFEARARYSYCYSPLFITCAFLGYSNLSKRIKELCHRKNNKPAPNKPRPS